MGHELFDIKPKFTEYFFEGTQHAKEAVRASIV